MAGGGSVQIGKLGTWRNGLQEIYSVRQVVLVLSAQLALLRAVQPYGDMA